MNKENKMKKKKRKQNEEPRESSTKFWDVSAFKEPGSFTDYGVYGNLKLKTIWCLECLRKVLSFEDSESY